MNFKRIISSALLLLLTFSLAVFALCILFPKEAQRLNFYVASYPRHYFASASAFFGFSLFEMLVIASPILIFLALFYINRAVGNIDARRRFVFLLSLISLLPSSYVFMIAVPSLSPSPLSLNYENIDFSDIISAAKILSGGVNELSEKVGAELSYSFLSDELSDSYNTVFDGYGIPTRKLPPAKPLCFSKALSYTGALAMYSPPTGEINISTEIPEYMIPFTVAHEYAHLLGVSGESDANVLAFICCERSENETVRYSARLFILEYVLADLYTFDRKMYINIYNSLSDEVKNDIREHAEYSRKYESSKLFRISDRLNSAHLKIWDSTGQKSYSTTSAKISEYLKNNQKPPV